MDIKDLNNYQLVLLTLLISFVTSIATGIITVYLLAQAPIPVTDVINNVIERTIDKVSPTSGTIDQNSQKPQTVIINEDDLISEALAQGFKETGALYSAPASQTDTSPSSTTTPPASTTASSSGQTVVANQQGSLVSLGALIDTAGHFVIPGNYTPQSGDYVSISGGTYAISNVLYDKATNISTLTLAPEQGASSFADLSPNGLGDIPKIGQTALIIGMDDGFIKTTVKKVLNPTDSKSNAEFSVLETPTDAFAGSPVLSNDGRIIGIVSFDADGGAHIYAVSSIQSAMKGSATSQ